MHGLTLDFKTESTLDAQQHPCLERMDTRAETSELCHGFLYFFGTDFLRSAVRILVAVQRG